jgi:hypothetical protein
MGIPHTTAPQPGPAHDHHRIRDLLQARGFRHANGHLAKETTSQDRAQDHRDTV